MIKPSTKKKEKKKTPKKTKHETFIEDITDAWNNPDYSELTYSGTAVSTPTLSGTVETVFGKNSDVFKEWTKAQKEIPKYCNNCKKIFFTSEKYCPKCGKEFL